MGAYRVDNCEMPPCHLPTMRSRVQSQNLDRSASTIQVVCIWKLLLLVLNIGALTIASPSARKRLAVGVYPKVSLKLPRFRRDEARGLLGSGVDPSSARRAEKLSRQLSADSSFELLATEWFETHYSKALAKGVVPHGVRTIMNLPGYIDTAGAHDPPRHLRMQKSSRGITFFEGVRRPAPRDLSNSLTRLLDHTPSDRRSDCLTRWRE
jgi:hypothetical protein